MAAKSAKLYDVRIAEEVLFSEPFMGGEHTKTVHRWTITIADTSYQCVIDECPCGLRREIGVVYASVPLDAPDWATRARKVERVYSVLLTNCVCRSEAHRGVKPTERDRVCHGWHRARIDHVFGEIARPAKISTSLRAYGLAAAR